MNDQDSFRCRLPPFDLAAAKLRASEMRGVREDNRIGTPELARRALALARGGVFK